MILQLPHSLLLLVASFLEDKDFCAFSCCSNYIATAMAVLEEQRKLEASLYKLLKESRSKCFVISMKVPFYLQRLDEFNDVILNRIISSHDDLMFAIQDLLLLDCDSIQFNCIYKAFSSIMSHFARIKMTHENVLFCYANCQGRIMGVQSDRWGCNPSHSNL